MLEMCVHRFALWAGCVLVLLAGVASGFDGCQIRYGRRGCHDKIHTGVLVTCDGLGRESFIPKSIPWDTVYLSMSNFNIRRLERANFTRFKSIECMTILDSGIEEVEYDTFADLEVLHELELKNTRLNGSELEFIANPEFRAKLVSISYSKAVTSLNFSGSTTNLQRLKGLNLDGNGLVYLNPSILSNLIAAERLDLSSNRLSVLDWYRVGEMVNLNQLLLNDNRLQSIPAHVQNTFMAVKELRLANNPFHCNCKLRWLKEYYDIADDKVVDYDMVSCASPFQGLMAAVPSDRFICRSPADPVIYFERLEVPGEEHLYSVTCNSTGDPAPTLRLSWGGDGERLAVPPPEDLSTLHTTTPRIILGPGKLTCSATNSEGEVTVEETIPVPEQFSSAAAWRVSVTTLAAVFLANLLIL